MEKRLLLFFGVTFLLVSLWPRIFPPPVPPEPPPAAGEVADLEPDEEGEREPAAPVVEAPEEERGPAGEERKVAEARRASSERTVVVETPLYRMELTNRGGRMVSFRLAEHRDARGEPFEMVSRSAAQQLDVYPLDVRVDDPATAAALQKALFEVEGAARLTVANGEEKSVKLSWSDGQGLEAVKTVTIFGGTFQLGVEVSVREDGRELPKAIVFGPGVGDHPMESRYVGTEKGILAAGGEVVLLSESEVEEGEGVAARVTATGVASHYFAGLMVPARSGGGSYGARLERATVQISEAAESPSEERGDAATQAVTSARDVITALLSAPARPAELTLYVGPKKVERLRALAPGLENIIEFGSWMRYPALLLRGGLMAIYERVGNYGWAIVLLTVVINLFLVPLKHYSFVSMRKMQKIAPQMQKIRERYKKVKPTDPRYQEMNQEIMALQKKHGVNPISGCLPMLLMIPFFFAFYRLLMASVELRQAPFVFWIEDLSQYDPLYVLPILMGVTQIAIQKMTPQTTADPIQTKIMSFMPVMFTLILLWAPSGLVLYWFSNNLVSMAQQTVTNRLLEDRDEKAVATEQAKGTVKNGRKGGKGKRRKGKGSG